MRTYQHTAFTDLDRYDILYGGHKSDAGVDFYIDVDFIIIIIIIIIIIWK
jgi:hypothetical protein